MNLRTFLIILVLLLCLIPGLYGPGRYLLYLLDSLLIILGLFLLLRVKTHLPRHNLLTVSGGAFLAWSALSLTWSVNHFETLVWISQLTLAAAAFLICFSLGQNESNIRAWLKGYSLVAAGLSL